MPVAHKYAAPSAAYVALKSVDPDEMLMWIFEVSKGQSFPLPVEIGGEVHVFDSLASMVGFARGLRCAQETHGVSP
jgi:hypothetical protein